MILKFFLIATLLLTLSFFYLYYPILKAKRTANKLVAENIPYEKHPTNPNMHILVAGDSTAAGVGTIDSKGSISGRLGQLYPNADITNRGVSGDRLLDLLNVLNKQKGAHYDLIVLQIGTNDITHFTSLDIVRTELSEILALCNKMSKKTILLTSGNVGNSHVFHWPVSRIITARTLDVRSIFMEEAGRYKSVTYIDLFTDLEHDPFEKDIKRYYAPDLFHLTGDGYGIWFERIKEVLQKT